MIKKSIAPVALILIMIFNCMASEPPVSDQVQNVIKNYEKYRESTIKDRFFKHSDIIPLIRQHAASELFKHEIAGSSVQGRSINHLTVGHGKTKVLLWSQMHGDEPTATMAIFDLLNFFNSNGDEVFKKFILQNLELHFLPMLNPDGAQLSKRRNAQDIDINRDARAQVTPEGRILLELAKKLEPEFGFNLHDQSTYYSAGQTANSATVSFLAPAYNYEKEMNEVRTKATQVIVGMNTALQQYIPGKVARYNDDFEPRAFGDNLQRMGISTILIESGGYPGDPEKQYIRKLNFLALIHAFDLIARGSYAKESLEAYDDIPQNSRALYDLIIRNVEVEVGGQLFSTNLAVNRTQVKSSDYRSVSYRGTIEEVGDIEQVFGYEELDGKLLKVLQPKVRLMTRKEWDRLKPEDELKLLKQGYMFIKWSDGNVPAGPIKNRLLNLTNKVNYQAKTGLGQYANFILTKNEEPVYAVVNGFLINLNDGIALIPNTGVF